MSTQDRSRTLWKKKKNLKPTIKVLGAITDSISMQVREQYEEYPYPSG